MKKILFVLILCFGFNQTILAQLPQAMNYQAVARNSNGTLLPNANIGLRFSILDNSPSGTVQYAETQNTLTNQFGLFTVNIGQGTVQTGAFAFISWYTGNKYLQVEMDATGGTSYSFTSTSPLLSVPFALVAEKLSTPPQLILDDLIDVYTPTPVTGQVLKFNGVTWMPDLDSNTQYQAGAGILLSGDSIYNTGDTDASDDLITGTAATGDLRGNFPAPQVASLLGRQLLDSIPNEGDVLQWDSLAAYWKPARISEKTLPFELPFADSVNTGMEALAIWNSGTAAYFSSDSAYALLTGNGNVGIGTPNPTAKLDVSGDINSNGKILRTSTGSSNLVPIAFGAIDGAGNIYTDATTPNITVSKIGLGAYDITIAGELFDFTKYAVSIALADGYAGLTAYTSFNGMLEITTFEISGLASDRIYSHRDSSNLKIFSPAWLKLPGRSMIWPCIRILHRHLFMLISKAKPKVYSR